MDAGREHEHGQTAAAPLLEADGVSAPPGGSAVWLESADGVRLRAALWPDGARGTAVFFQGRTEFIEKYYEPIARFRALGFAAAAIDWRGQGLSDRAFADRRKGYVGEFAEFQRDVDALLRFLRTSDAPTPWLLVGHSMGGAISARTLMRQSSELGGDLGVGGREPPFAACVLSAPMLGLYGRLTSGPVARIVAGASVALGLSGGYALGMNAKTTADHGFEGNVLTTDADRFGAYAELVGRHEGVALGGPTWGWLRAALREIRALRPTETPTLLAIGEDDAVVSVAAAKLFAAAAPATDLLLLPGARHEPFIECDPVQDRLWRGIGDFLDRQGV